MEWIDINDIKPENKKRVLVFDADGFGVLTGRLHINGWYLEGDLSQGANITHWAELPKPPKAI